MNTMFFGFEGVKEGCEGEVQTENLAGGEWARCGSPPMTPGTCRKLFLFGGGSKQSCSRCWFLAFSIVVPG